MSCSFPVANMKPTTPLTYSGAVEAYRMIVVILVVHLPEGPRRQVVAPLGEAFFAVPSRVPRVHLVKCGEAV
jgi:hypothetical protein